LLRNISINFQTHGVIFVSVVTVTSGEFHFVVDSFLAKHTWFELFGVEMG
jgi:hypothetical protein